MSEVKSQSYDAASLERATARVIEIVAKTQEMDDHIRRKASFAVMAILRAGYARRGLGRFDEKDLVEAAVTRYRAESAS